MRALAIDFETANAARASACAVGLAWIEDGVIVGSAYHLIRPQKLDFGFYETRVHGLTAEDVADAPEFPEIFAQIQPFLGTHLMMAHNQSFDVAVLKASAELYGLPLQPFEVLCTVELARSIWPGRGGHKLSDVALHLGATFRHHHAEDDAIMAARVGVHAAGLYGVAGMRAAAAAAGVAVRAIDPAAVAPAREATAPAKARAARRPAGGIDGRRGAGVDGADDDVLTFDVAGSTGRRYRVVAGYRQGALFVRCGCMAGRNGRICHHVRDLAEGCADSLLSANAADVTAFARRCDGEGGLARLFELAARGR